MTTLAFIDTETTGLDPDRHEIWEVGLVLRTFTDVECERPAHADGHHGPDCHAYDVPTDTEYLWQLPVDLSGADPIALNIGRYHDRRWPDADGVDAHRAAITGQPVPGIERACLSHLGQWADRFVELTRGTHLVGAVVSFDAERLFRLLRGLGQCPMWHYHLVDVEALAAGYLAGKHRGLSPEGPTDDRHALAQPPWSSDELSRAVGVDPDQFDRHTALGDAHWAAAIYDAVMEAR